MESWAARGGQVRERTRDANGDGRPSRGGGEGGREFDGEKAGSAAGPGGLTSGWMGEAEVLAASAMESADPSERERAELSGEAASGEEDRPVGGSGSRLSWTVGGQGASRAGGGGALGAGAAAVAAAGLAG